MTASDPELDAVVVGASFAGLACALSLARSGKRVLVLERNAAAGVKLHTTGILVRDVVDRLPLMRDLPAELTRRIDGVRLYAPNLTSIDLAAPGYYFLATDTPGLLRWLAAQVEGAGAVCRWSAVFQGAARTASGWQLAGSGIRTRYLIGADGPRSAVARAAGLGVNRRFLAGIEHEYVDAPLVDADRLHCFIDRQIMPGYIGWVVQGVGITQVGLARRVGVGDGSAVKLAMGRFLNKIAPLMDFRGRTPVAVRAGLIPCGGVVRPVASARVLLVGDAAGMVSPVTAGGIHTALHHGLATGEKVAACLAGDAPDPGLTVARSYPRFRLKRILRYLFDHFQADWPCNMLLATRPVREAASLVFFHRRSVRAASGAGKRPGQLLRYLVLAVVVLLLVVAGHELQSHLASVDAWLSGLGRLGTITYLLLLVACTTVFVPESIFGVAAGALFGFWRGALLALAGNVLAAGLQYALARRIFTPLLARRIAKIPVFRRLRESLAIRTFKFQFVVRLSPLNPATVNYFLASSGVPFGRYVLATVAMLPHLAAEAYVGYAGMHVLRSVGGVGRGSIAHELPLFIGLVGTIIALAALWVFARRDK